jgi:hypothetical protein
MVRHLCVGSPRACFEVLARRGSHSSQSELLSDSAAAYF